MVGHRGAPLDFQNESFESASSGISARPPLLNDGCCAYGRASGSPRGDASLALDDVFRKSGWSEHRWSILMSASSAEHYARLAMSSNKDADEKLKLIAQAIAELAKVVGSMQSDLLSMRR